MIVGITGFKGSGKSEVAAELVKQGFVRERFAGPLKDMMRALGLSEAQIDGDAKERPCALLGGKSPRHAMQTIGTEWGRKMIHPDLWIILWRARASKNEHVVCDDVRFPNEAAVIAELGGVIWRVARPGRKGDGHESERYIDDIPVSGTILNNSTLVALRKRANTQLALDTAKV